MAAVLMAGSALLAAEPTAGNAAGQPKPQAGLAYELFGSPAFQRLGASGSVSDVGPMDKGHNDWGLRFTGLLMPPVDGEYAVRAEKRGGGAAARPRAGAMPAGWLADWKTPPVRHRPLQIIHVIEPGKGLAQSTMGQVALGLGMTTPGWYSFEDARNVGLGGVVCNVSFRDYLRNEEAWKTLADGVKTCGKLGLDVWLYDEDGYPSGSAGGLVLKSHPAWEATVLAYDPRRPDPFVVRRAYEHTHAANNWYKARRFPNLLENGAGQSFVDHTHALYFERLREHFGGTVKAMFTDEPALIAANLGMLPEEARKNIPVVDPVDDKVRPLPQVPWSSDLAARYRDRYGSDLGPRRRSLFEGDTEEDRNVRRQYWALVADLLAERFYAPVQKWCRAHGVAASGHLLWEERLFHHPILVGNMLKMLTYLDIPGLDVLTSDPEIAVNEDWLTVGMPASAAVLSGGRRVMTEVSDFGEVRAGKPAGLDEMRATAAWQAAWGVTDFMLYYSLADHPADQYREYTAYVGRLNAILMDARPAPDVLLYYPIHDLWSEFRPRAEPVTPESQSPRMQKLVRSFLGMGRALARAQVPMTIIDHDLLAGARVTDDGRLSVKGQEYRAVLLPHGATPPAATATVLDRFRERGGRVIAEKAEGSLTTAAAILDALAPAYVITPRSEAIVLGAFEREGRRILMLVNVGRTAYAGHLRTRDGRAWTTLDPATAAVGRARVDGSTGLDIALAPRAAVLLVEER